MTVKTNLERNSYVVSLVTCSLFIKVSDAGVSSEPVVTVVVELFSVICGKSHL